MVADKHMPVLKGSPLSQKLCGEGAFSMGRRPVKKALVTAAVKKKTHVKNLELNGIG